MTTPSHSSDVLVSKALVSLKEKESLHLAKAFVWETRGNRLDEAFIYVTAGAMFLANLCTERTAASVIAFFVTSLSFLLGTSYCEEKGAKFKAAAQEISKERARLLGFFSPEKTHLSAKERHVSTQLRMSLSP